MLNKKETIKLDTTKLKARFLYKYEKFLNNPNLDPNYKIQKIYNLYSLIKY